MPRKKGTRNFRGSVLTRRVTKNGKKAVAYDARLRVARRDESGAVVRDEHGRILYSDRVVRCWSAPEANIALLNLINEVANEAIAAPKPGEHTFGELAAYYKREHVKPAVIVNGRKVAGFRRNLTLLRTIVDEMTEFIGASTPIRSVNFETLRSIAERLSQTPTRKETLPALSTVNDKLSILRRMLNVAIQKDWLDVNPFKRGKRLIDRSGETKRNRMLTFEEEVALFEACQPHTMEFEYKRHGKTIRSTRWVDRRHLIPLITIALDTALRVGEVFNIEPWQIDFEARVIYVTKAAADETKTGAPGIIPMTERVHEILSEMYRRSDWLPNEKIFRRFEYKRSFRSACREAGISDLQLRDSRSTGATRMVLAGNAESQVMKATRHKNIRIFLDHYTNVDVENARAIGRNLDKYLEKGLPKGEAKGEAALDKKRKAA